MTHPPLTSQVLYRIGVVSKLSGVPVPTLRIWQTRYNAFSPTTTQGQHRLYNEEDLRKAALLKSLTGQGHGISLIAGLSTEQLKQLLQTGADIANAPTQRPALANVAWVVVGANLASRMQSETFSATRLGQPMHIHKVWADLAEASGAQLDPAPDVLVVSVNGLNDSTAEQILTLSQKLAARQTVVLYSFGQLNAIAKLGRASFLVHHEPLNDLALATIIQSARPPLYAPSWVVESLATPIPSRQFSDAVLQRVVNIPSQVMCECPRHVAELIGQLGRFEDYSRNCLNESPKDAELHQQLNTMAASARALFEKALQMVATHEGISLAESA
ncbi:MerR family transcriptional regulator [Limnohabitans sp.]|uniref:MerR family transcriptional regulator n=1 Tax=Limnohabitans sp. TaxID=1907725 RepID=UPI0037C03612